MVKQSTDGYRYERKFAIGHLSRPEVERIIRSHGRMFREVYAPRSVNNLYFDTFASGQYIATVEGQKDREKYRLRWYGPLRPHHVPRAQFEIKIRRNAMNRKRVFPIESGFHSDDPTHATTVILNCDAVPGEVKEQLHRMHPVLINSYQRQYFLSADGKLRVTIDHDIQYMDVYSKDIVAAARLRPRRLVVVEMKYDPETDDLARETASSLPFRLTKNSKYTNGVEALKLRALWA